MKKKFGVYGYVVSFLAALVLLALPCERAEAKYQYSTQTKSLTKAGEYQIQQKEDERIVFLFKPEQSGVYLVRATSQQAGLDSACMGFGRDGKEYISSYGLDGARVIYSTYCEKGTICPIAIGVGKYIGGAGDAIKSVACEYKLEIIRTSYRVQKLSTKKGCNLSKRDFNYKEAIPPFVTFEAKKTGYYRFYRKNSIRTDVEVMERGKDGSIRYLSVSRESDKMLKLKKGKHYILQINTDQSIKLMAQYVAKKRTIDLHYNYPWKNGDETCEYDVQKGSKLGVLLPPVPTENYFADGGKMQKKRKFLGWYTKKKGGKKITAKTKNCQKIKKLYAHWK